CRRAPRAGRGISVPQRDAHRRRGRRRHRGPHAARPAAPAAGVGRHRATAKLLPDAPAVACFDTAFHATLPPAASTYALPAAWNERFGLRRFGFHGLSHAWATRRAAELLGRGQTELRLVTAHLGAGASLCAVDRGRSVATT